MSPFNGALLCNRILIIIESLLTTLCMYWDYINPASPLYEFIFTPVHIRFQANFK